MPLYEYECIECGNRFEFLVRSTEEDIPCPDCGGEQIKKLFSTFSHRTSVPGTSGHGDTAPSLSSGSSCSSCSSGNCAQCR